MSSSRSLWLTGNRAQAIPQGRSWFDVTLWFLDLPATVYEHANTIAFCCCLSGINAWLFHMRPDVTTRKLSFKKWTIKLWSLYLELAPLFVRDLAVIVINTNFVIAVCICCTQFDLLPTPVSSWTKKSSSRFACQVDFFKGEIYSKLLIVECREMKEITNVKSYY